MTAQQLAYTPLPPTTQMLIMPQPSSSPILLPKGVCEQNGNPLAIPQLLAAWGYLRGMDSVPCQQCNNFSNRPCSPKLSMPPNIRQTQLQTPVVIVNLILRLSPAHTIYYQTLLLALALPCYTQVAEPHTSTSWSWHFYEWLPFDAMMNTTALQIQGHIYLLRMVYRWAVTKLKRCGKINHHCCTRLNEFLVLQNDVFV